MALPCRHFVHRSDVALDKKQLRRLPHRATAHLQNDDGFIVFPFVDNVAHQIGIAALWHRLEEAATDDGALIDHAGQRKGRGILAPGRTGACRRDLQVFLTTLYFKASRVQQSAPLR
jgi:hypothetical protein